LHLQQTELARLPERGSEAATGVRHGAASQLRIGPHGFCPHAPLRELRAQEAIRRLFGERQRGRGVAEGERELGAGERHCRFAYRVAL
jgi:hypothetical protein